MRWSEIPKGAKAYMVYHALIEPQLIAWLLLPLYMMLTGYSVLDVGVLFTLVNVALIPATYIMGRAFNRWDIKKGLMVIDALDGIAYIFYGLAQGAYASIMLFLGRLIEKVSTILYPLYRAYEQIIYPEDKYEEIFAWHLRIPEISRLISYPILGYIFGYVFFKPEHYRMAFMIFGLLSIPTILYIHFFLPSVGREERIQPEGFKFRVGEFKLLLLFEALFTLSWALAPTFVLINYVVFTLHKTIFEVTLIECANSVAMILGTYLSERFPKEKGFIAMSLGMFISALYALIMALSPPFWLAIVAYMLEALGSAIWFPFYRAWKFSLIPKDRVSEFHAAISSYNRIISLFAPLIAGGLATIHPTLPYGVSLITFVVMAILFLILRVARTH
ncbi:MFS transporter [Pyrococcus kukulkanii]|uniref:MFS transporter n=1 Tax=Pyrococcus kukulkanii TaxID=1609559 RepID=A0A127BCF4_9EURY|nr:MFS transporter [Pyrococcus kukulkanii]AMM55011.1 MFS transporter [Pyrococcus kukulkanii]